MKSSPTCPFPLLPCSLRNDTAVFRRLLGAAAPAWLEDPAADVTVLAPTDLAMQRSSLTVAAFAGPQQGNASAPAAAAPGPAATPGQLAGVYVLPRSLSLTQLAALDGQLLETGTEGWALAVHAGPPAVAGVRAFNPQLQRWLLLRCAALRLAVGASPAGRRAGPSPAASHARRRALPPSPSP